MSCSLCGLNGHNKNNLAFHPLTTSPTESARTSARLTEKNTIDAALALIALSSSAPNTGKKLVLRIPKKKPVAPSEAKPEHRKREDTGHHEKEDIQAIVEAIQSRSSAGLRIMEAFRSKFREEILDARNDGGSRTKHWDFSVLVGPAPGVWKTVEHKGSQTFAPIPESQKPWTAGVQFHNGGCEKQSIGKQQARCWYDTQIASGRLAAEWSLTSATPSFEEWFTKDAKVQGDPKTAFGKELKQKVRAARGDRGSLLEKRAEVNAAFNLDEAALNGFKAEVLNVINGPLNQKDQWLTIHGSVKGDFECAWYPKFVVEEIESVVMRKEHDIQFDFVCRGGFRFCCLLRWGKGAGFSNLRIDSR